MAKEVIHKYLSKYKDEYSLSRLKKKLIGAGYDKKEVDEVAKKLESKKKSKSLNDYSNKEKVEKVKGKGMFVAGIIGFIFLIFSILEIVLSLTDLEIPISNTMYIIVLILGIIFFILLLLYYYGFFKLGKATNSKMLRVSSLAILILFILSLIVVITGSLIVNSMVETSFYSASSVSGSMASASSINPSDLSLFPGMSLIFPIVFFIIFLALIVFIYLFYISLIKIGNKVRFAKLAGWVGLIFIILNTLLMIGVLLLMFSPILLAQSSFLMHLAGNSVYQAIFLGIGVVLGLLSLLTILFQSLTLIKASNKYER